MKVHRFRPRAAADRNPGRRSIRSRLRRPSVYEAVAIALGAAAMGGVAFATIPSNGVISACYVKSGGALRIIDADTSACNPRENTLAWNVQGTPGEDGSPGISGLETKFAIGPFDSDSPKSMTVTCPEGKKVIGMGGNVNPGTVDLGGAGENNVHMTQLLVDGAGTTVRVRGAEVGAGTSGNWNLVPQAICANVAP
jgi:hypothetical protein